MIDNSDSGLFTSRITWSQSILTGLHLVFQSGGAVDNQLLQGNRLVGDLQVEQLLHVLGMVEVQNLLVAVVASVYVVQQNIDDLLEELARLRRSRFDVRHNICKMKRNGKPLIHVLLKSFLSTAVVGSGAVYRFPIRHCDKPLERKMTRDLRLKQDESCGNGNELDDDVPCLIRSHTKINY